MKGGIVDKVTLAVDPGSTESAWVLWSGGSIIQSAKIENEALRLFMKQRGPFERVVIEMIACYGMPVGKEVFETCLWIGRFIECANGLPVRLVFRKDIKMHLCNSTRAKDGNVRRALIDKVGPQGTKKNKGPTYGVAKDIWSALALAAYDDDNPEV